MLTIKAIGNAHSYRAYLSIEAIGEWIGEGAKLLGIEGREVGPEFQDLRLGLHPSTGEKLRRNTPVDRVYNLTTRDGREYQKTYYAAQVYDCVIGAPKTVSVLAIEDQRAAESHRQAVARIVGKIEDTCGPVVIAQFHHNYSRTEDPHIHSHLVAMNLSWQGDKWQTLHASRLIRRQEEITDAYRESLLGQLHRHGYEIEWPNVAGIPEELVEKFSQRSAQRDEAIEQFREKHKLASYDPVSTKEVSVLVREDRPDKPRISYEQFWEQQKERLTQAERISLKETVEIAQEKAYRLSLRHGLRWDVGDAEDSGPELTIHSYGHRISI